jgi:hypothetical protein
LQWKIILWMCQGSRCLFLMCENLSYILRNVMKFFYKKSVSFLWFMQIYWHACVSCICGFCSSL